MAGELQVESRRVNIQYLCQIQQYHNPLISMGMLHEYMVKGILDSHIFQDGGPECYAEIPKLYHVISGFTSALVHLIIIKNWSHTLTSRQQQLHTIKSSNLFEKFVALNCIVSLILTLYFKMMTGKGMFIFNPCHVSLLLVAVLLLAPTTDFTRKLHSCWTAWLFGAIMALFIPHLYGITQFQVYLYYYQHLLIFPVGPIVLYRRYGYVLPSFKNQMAAFGTMVVYQLGVLLPLSLMTMVNLNFALCHSPADPFFQYVGYHYFSGGVIALNIFSSMARWITYLMVLPLKIYFDSRVNKINGKGAKQNGHYNTNGVNTNGANTNGINGNHTQHENNGKDYTKKSKSPKRQ